MKRSELRLPVGPGELEEYAIGPGKSFPTVSKIESRRAYAAAHVVADPLAENGWGIGAAIDWDSTLRFREYLWSHGFGVAEAMDTAQRGMGLDWKASKELIRRSATAAIAAKHAIVCGAGTDQLPGGRSHQLMEIADAYQEQCDWIEECGGQVVIMASRALVATARSFDDYREVYGKIVRGCRDRVLLHWLGPMFDPLLSGYWGADTLDEATENFLNLLVELADRIEGIKVSLLDKNREVALRESLPPGMKLFTGDDFSYPDLILGNKTHFSHALLGVFDGIAPAASAAFGALDRGNGDEFLEILRPTVPLAQHIFQEPTYYYKTGLVFLAYLNGLQTHFRMVGGLESARSVPHLSRLFILADQAGLLSNPELAVERMRAFLKLAGVD
ncbi:MAG TPA: dihydrodipicolinate synthase family protein [Chthoniobacterales bacterium]|nr:dihydrodipicolinate synthase family protein [Chthoniobacterales bacterium]